MLVGSKARLRATVKLSSPSLLSVDLSLSCGSNHMRLFEMQPLRQHLAETPTQAKLSDLKLGGFHEGWRRHCAGLFAKIPPRMGNVWLELLVPRKQQPILGTSKCGGGCGLTIAVLASSVTVSAMMLTCFLSWDLADIVETAQNGTEALLRKLCLNGASHGNWPSQRGGQNVWKGAGMPVGYRFRCLDRQVAADKRGAFFLPACVL